MPTRFIGVDLLLVVLDLSFQSYILHIDSKFCLLRSGCSSVDGCNNIHSLSQFLTEQSCHNSNLCTYMQLPFSRLQQKLAQAHGVVRLISEVVFRYSFSTLDVTPHRQNFNQSFVYLAYWECNRHQIWLTSAVSVHRRFLDVKVETLLHYLFLYFRTIKDAVNLTFSHLSKYH